MTAFITPYDIANRALQMIGVPRITTFADTSRQAQEAGFLYDKARRAELRRFVWTFATRRVPLRPVTSTIVNLVFPAYNAATAYVAGDIVLYGNALYSCLVAGTGQTPGVGGFAPYWEAYYGPLQAEAHSNATTYFPGDIVMVSTTVYRNINILSNINHVPPNATYWMAPAGASSLSPLYHAPTNYDPPAATSTTVARTMYRLPANYLRMAPQDPKKPSVARLGTTAGINYNDWEIENGFIVTTDTTGGLIFRFVADTTNVMAMEDMFCEAVACRMALSINEVMTQRPDLSQFVTSIYTRLVREAQIISAIEGGSTEQDVEVFMQQPPQLADRKPTAAQRTPFTSEA